MHLAYFDENKFTEADPHFVVGGILVSQEKAVAVEQDLSQIQFNVFGTRLLRQETEFHGKEILHGKGAFKRQKLADRIQIFRDLGEVVVRHGIASRFVIVDVHEHRSRYTFPIPEYRLGLMLILERFCDYLDDVDDLGVVFGDYEKDEITQSVVSFSEFKRDGATPILGRPIDRLLDTVYFTQSHHSRYLQLADVLVYLAARYEASAEERGKWHEVEARSVWERIKASTDVSVQHWP